jgi:branched-chain amino acid transport system substrate-binding protein
MKRLLSVLMLVALLGVMLAACGGAATPPATEAPAAPTEAAAAPTEAATEAATTEATTAATAPAAGGDAQLITDYLTELAGQLEGVDLGTIKVATQSPLSGPQSVLGVSISNSATLGVEQFAELLADTGATFEVAPFDDQAQPEVGSANAKSIVSDPDILCVVGHLNSGVALASLPDYQNAGLSMVSPANTNPAITESGYENAFRVVGRDDLQGPIGARFAQENLNASSVYIIHDTTDYGQGVAEFFREEAEGLGVTVSGFEGTQEAAVFDSLITPILAANPDVIYFGGIYSQAGPFFRQARDRGVTAQFLGPDGLDSSELANLAGDALEGTYYTTVAAPVTYFPDAATFATDYEAAYGEGVQPFGAQSYDSAGFCMAAIAKAAVDAGAKPTREQVTAAMHELPELQGITGVYEFTEKGDPTEAAYYILEANTDPAAWGENELAAQIESAPPTE